MASVFGLIIEQLTSFSDLSSGLYFKITLLCIADELFNIYTFRVGEMAERSKATVLKTVESVRAPGVRIPLSPPILAELGEGIDKSSFSR